MFQKGSAHSFRAGEIDDSEVEPLPVGEVHSGSNDDDTLERVPGASESDWSIMHSRWGQDAAFYYTVTANQWSFQRMYYPFSIEEVVTIEEP